MRKKRLARLTIYKGTIVEYYITIDDMAKTERYGVSVICQLLGGCKGEWATANHIFSRYSQAKDFVLKLADGMVMPITLFDLVEDYLLDYEK